MVVFFDIDGTLIDNATQIIPASAARAIGQLLERGHIPVVNTGRPYTHLDPRVVQLPFRGYVCGCGMELRLDGERIFYAHPSRELCRFAAETVAEYGMEALFEADDGSIVLSSPNALHPALVKECKQMEQKGFSVHLISEHPDFMKLVAWDGPNSRREDYIRAISTRFTLIYREQGMLEHVMPECSKAEGMLRLLEHLGIAPEDTLTIGDSTNDLPMFSVAGHTVCMGGGMEELKQQAEYITAPVLEDGIEQALRHYGLLG